MHAYEWITSLPDTPKPELLPPETQRVSSTRKQRVSLSGKQRVFEESRTNLHHILNAPDLQTNEGYIPQFTS